jgi:hypothetical protein
MIMSTDEAKEKKGSAYLQQLQIKVMRIKKMLSIGETGEKLKHRF